MEIIEIVDKSGQIKNRYGEFTHAYTLAGSRQRVTLQLHLKVEFCGQSGRRILLFCRADGVFGMKLLGTPLLTQRSRVYLTSIIVCLAVQVSTKVAKAQTAPTVLQTMSHKLQQPTSSIYLVAGLPATLGQGGH
jgi:hypothetical protein